MVAKKWPSANFDIRMKIDMSSQRLGRIDILVGDTYQIHPFSVFIDFTYFWHPQPK